MLNSLPAGPPPPTEAGGAGKPGDGSAVMAAPHAPLRGSRRNPGSPGGPPAGTGPSGRRTQRTRRRAAPGGSGAQEPRGESEGGGEGGGEAGAHRGLGAVVLCRALPSGRERRRTTTPRVPRAGPASRRLVQHVVRLTRSAPAPPAAPRPAAAPPLPAPGTAGQRGRGAAALPRIARLGAAGPCRGRPRSRRVRARGSGWGVPRFSRCPQEGRGPRAARPCPLAARLCPLAVRPWHAPGPAPPGAGSAVPPGSAGWGRRRAGRGGPARCRCWKRPPGLAPGRAAAGAGPVPRR